MSYNDYTYTVVKVNPDGRALVAGLGFPIGAESTNGELLIVDKKDAVKETIPPGLIPEKPSYVTEEFPDFPFLSHEEALQLVHYEASEKGGNDGWCYNDK